MPDASADSTSTFPPLSDYGLIGDTRSAALVNRDGGIDWLCWPRFDSPAVFCALLDRERGGRCDVVASDAGSTLAPVGRTYRAGSLILETTLAQRDRATGAERGRLTVVDAMPVRQRPCSDTDAPQSPEDDVDIEADGRLVREFRCDAGAVDVVVRVWPTFDFAGAPTVKASRLGGRRAVLLGGGLTLVVDASRAIEVDAACATELNASRATLRLSLSAGERAWLALSHDVDAPVPDDAAAARWLDETTRYWSHWTSQIRYDGRWKRAVHRGLLTLKAMTHSPTGAIVAAPTLGLPEAIGGPRNYDYRFSWIRDSGFTVRALLACGHRREARAFVRHLVNADVDMGRALPVLLTLDGAKPGDSERRLDALAGYAGSKPIVAGNAAATQRQNDIYGEAIIALHAYWELTGELPPDGGDPRSHIGAFVRNLAECVEQVWHLPDASLWERRDGERHYVHSKALCYLALDRAAQLAVPLGLDADAERWRALAATIRADYLTRGWNPRLNAYAGSYGDDATLDAAVLRAGLLGAFDFDDPRFVATIDAVRDRLGAASEGAPDLIYRYRESDGIAGDEGTFTSAAFWVAICLAQSGRREEGEAMFDRLLTRGSDLALFAEEIDARTGAHLGNMPQGFTHMAVVNGAVRIEALARGAASGNVRGRADAPTRAIFPSPT